MRTELFSGRKSKGWEKSFGAAKRRGSRISKGIEFILPVALPTVKIKIMRIRASVRHFV